MAEDIAVVLCVQLLYCKAMFAITQSRGLLRHIRLLLILLLPAGVAAQPFAQVAQQNPVIQVQQLLSGLGVPWGMTFIDAERLLITERAGQLRLFDLQTQSLHSLRGLPAIVAEGQGGLLDVATGPDHARDGWIYFTYSKPARGEAATTLARARLDDLQLVNWLRNNNKPYLLVYTKADKLSANQRSKNAALLDAGFGVAKPERQLFSAKTGMGRENLLLILDSFLF